jgi:hypothetical protein
MGRPAPVHHLSTATPSYRSVSERVGLLAAGDDLTFEPLTFLQIVNLYWQICVTTASSIHLAKAMIAHRSDLDHRRPVVL